MTPQARQRRKLATIPAIRSTPSAMQAASGPNENLIQFVKGWLPVRPP